MANEDTLFQNGKVRGILLTDLLRWATNESREFRPFGKLALPPVQRSPVWGPKQIVDLWDSAFRGLPLGSFYLVERGEHDQARDFGARSSTREMGKGWSLLDGQQRLRALLAGWQGPPKDLENGAGPDMRCVWVELDDKPDQTLPTLHLTSNSQPFGYDPSTGQKLPKRERKDARTECDYLINGREAYDHELFENILSGAITDAAGKTIQSLPEPASAKSGRIFRLDALLSVWTKSNVAADFVSGIKDTLRDSAPNADQIDLLTRCFKAMDNAPIALVKVHIEDEKRSTGGEGGALQLLRLFDRIGTGGTRLSEEDRLFSVYKSHVPKIDRAIQSIYADTGHVLSPTKIAGTAIRIANARTHEDPTEGNYQVGTSDFIKYFKSFDGLKGPKRSSTLEAELEQLIPAEGLREKGPLAKAFRSLFTGLGGSETGLPAMMRASLNPLLVEVLVFATLIAKDESAEFWWDAIRFALVWQLYTTDDNRAAAICFRVIRQSAPNNFRFRSLYRAMVDTEDGKAACELVSCKAMRQMLCLDKNHVFASWRDRFDIKARGDNTGLTERDLEVAHRWWTKQGLSLQRWLQRAYLNMLYGGFNPAFGSDEDTPYDIDHIVPHNEWGANWQTVAGKLKSYLQENSLREDDYRYSRHVLGESVGNKWLIDSTSNRGAGKDSFAEKLGRLRKTGVKLTDDLLLVMPEPHCIWFKASAVVAEGKWGKAGLAAFQTAVEERATMLYCDFHTTLRLAEWQ